ncbi:MAG: isoprenylcysteine carboxylmethyltransferase family protein [Actinobacteria bacterium]|nr:isoprenylcysteine carboxylmethyltransferase family protein [Actinomycetota bacterium]
MSRNPLSLSLVMVQGLSIIFIFLTGPVLLENFFLFILEIAALALGAWSVLTMSHKSRVSITPEVAPGGKLITEGPYTHIRHPMYTSLLILTLILVINFFTWQRLVFWIILLIDLIIKLHYEESVLEKHFYNYQEYQQKTKKLIPFIY